MSVWHQNSREISRVSYKDINIIENSCIVHTYLDIFSNTLEGSFRTRLEGFLFSVDIFTILTIKIENGI